MPRLFTIQFILWTLLVSQCWISIDAAKQKSYSKTFPITLIFSNLSSVSATGIGDLVRSALRRGLNRFTAYPTSYDSDVFRYTQSSQRGSGGLYAGKWRRFIWSALKCLIMITQRAREKKMSLSRRILSTIGFGLFVWRAMLLRSMHLSSMDNHWRRTLHQKMFLNARHPSIKISIVHASEELRKL